MGLEEAYTREILKQRGTYATYPFADMVSVGDYGRLDGNTFISEGKLENLSWYKPDELQVAFGPRSETIDLTSSGEIEVTFKAKGKTTSAGSGVIPLDSAGFIVEFGDKHSVVLQCQGVCNISLSHLTSVSGEILEQYKNGKWPKDRVLVTEVWNAESTFVAVSKSRDVTVELEVTGSVSGGGINELANVDAGLKFRSSSSAVEHSIMKEKWNPYFVLYRIKDPVVGSTSFEKI